MFVEINSLSDFKTLKPKKGVYNVLIDVSPVLIKSISNFKLHL